MMTNPEPAHSGGRPSKLTPETAEKILAAVRQFQRLDVAAGIAGVGRETLYGWLRIGIRTRNRLTTTAMPSNLTEHERRCADFLARVEEAHAFAEAAAVHSIKNGGLQPSIETKITHRCVGHHDGEPVWVTETVTTEKPPDTRNIQWLLERRNPAYRSKSRVEVTAENAPPVELTFAATLEDIHRTISEGQKAIDPVGTAVDPEFAATLAEIHRTISAGQKPIPVDSEPTDDDEQ